MSLLSGIGKIGNYFVKGCKVYGPTVFGTGQEAMQKAYTDLFKARGTKVLSKQFLGDFWDGTKAAGKAAKENAANVAKKGGFLKNAWKSIKTTPRTLKAGARWGRMQAAAKGSNKLLGSIKGVGKALGKKMPLIGSLLLVAFELPNIVKATKEQGLLAGIKETGKAAARLGGFTAGMAAGAAVGSLICPGIGSFIGGMIGGMIGDWAVGKVVGKSYSEKQVEAQEQIAQQEQYQQQYQQVPQQAYQQVQNYTSNPFGNPTLTPQQLLAYQQALYGNMSDDFMYNNSRLNYLS